MDFRPCIVGLVLGALLALPAGRVAASPFDLGYGGRLTDAGGLPLAGPVDVTVRFFRSATAGTTSTGCGRSRSGTWR